MNYIDLLISVPLIWGGFSGFRKGLVIEIASIVALIAGLYGALEFSVYVALYLNEHLQWSARAVQMTSFFLTFIGIVLLVHLIARGIQKLVKLAALGLVNRLMGMVFGVLKYAVLISVLVYFIDSANKRYPFIPQDVREGSLLFDFFAQVTREIYPKVEAFVDSPS